VYRVRYRDPDRIERSRTFERKVDAERFANSIESDISRGDYIDPQGGQVVFEDRARKWLKSLSVKPKTKTSYESLLRSRVLPAFGKRRLVNILPSDVQEWVAGMQRDGLSASRIRQAAIVLQQVMDAAVRDRLIARNPCTGMKLPRIVKDEAAYFEPDAVDEIIGEIEAPYRLLFRILAVLGLRWGEAAALRRGHVDLLRKRIRVEDSLAEIDGRLEFGSTKSHAVRTIPIPPSIEKPLRDHLAELDKGADTLLFHGPKGGPIRYRYAYMKVWRPALERLGIPPVGLHVLRHSSAARLISAGASPKAVQSLMGHSSAGFTLNVYGHIFESDLDALAEMLDAQGSRSKLRRL
jgi:integrase